MTSGGRLLASLKRSFGGRWFSPYLAYGAGLVLVIVGLALIGIRQTLLVLLGLSLIVVGVLVALYSLWLALREIPDKYLRRASRGLLILFIVVYFLAIINPGGGDVAKGFWIDASAGSMTGLIILFLGEYVRQKGFVTAPSPQSDVRPEPRNQGYRWRFDEMLLAGRSPIAAAFTIVLLSLVASLIWTLTWGPVIGLSSAEIIETMLATGTVAIAYASLVQAVSAEKRRHGDLVPNLDLQIIETLNEPTTQDLFVLGKDRWTIRLRVRNLGPGNASKLRVVGVNWWPDTAHPEEELEALTKGGPIQRPLLTEPTMMHTDIVRPPFSLRANEDIDREFQFRIPPDSPKQFLKQTVIIAQCSDVEGNGLYVQRLALRLQVLLPQAGIPGSYRSIWKRLTDSDIAQIPGLSGVGASGR